MARPVATADDPLSRLTALAKPGLQKASLITVIVSLLWIVQAAAVGLIIHQLAGEPDNSSLPWMAAAVFAITGVVRSLLDQYSSRLCFQAADTVMAAARQNLLRSESRRSSMDPNRPPSAAVAALVTEKIAALHPYLMRYATARARVMSVPLIILLVCLPFSWVVSLILLLVGPLIPVFMALVGMAARDASEKHMHQIGTLNAGLLERLNALTDIRILDATAQTLNGFRESASDLHKRTMAVLRIAFLSSTVLELFSAIGVAMVALYTGFVLLGEIRFGYWGHSLGIGQAVFLLMLAPDYFQPLRDLATAWHDKAAAQAVADELDVLTQQTPLLIPGSEEPGTSTLSVDPEQPLLRSTGLSWETPTGNRLSFPDILAHPGQSIAICGPSGAGKSTLLALLAGQLQTQSGEIQLAGNSLDDSNAESWRAHIAWMSQSPWFINGSLRDNLTLGHNIEQQEKLEDALSLASIKPLLHSLPQGLDTHLGESGSGVSGGEARRLTLARLALARRPIILADEPTSDLDAETAAAVMDGLISLVDKGSTLIVATHDPQLMARMDHVVTIGREEA